jgi:hypothetical protein
MAEVLCVVVSIILVDLVGPPALEIMNRSFRYIWGFIVLDLQYFLPFGFDRDWIFDFLVQFQEHGIRKEADQIRIVDFFRFDRAFYTHAFQNPGKLNEKRFEKASLTCEIQRRFALDTICCIVVLLDFFF